jgi:hypothetical protein
MQDGSGEAVLPPLLAAPPAAGPSPRRRAPSPLAFRCYGIAASPVPAPLRPPPRVSYCLRPLAACLRRLVCSEQQATGRGSTAYTPNGVPAEVSPGGFNFNGVARQLLGQPSAFPVQCIHHLFCLPALHGAVQHRTRVQFHICLDRSRCADPPLASSALNALTTPPRRKTQTRPHPA